MMRLSSVMKTNTCICAGRIYIHTYIHMCIAIGIYRYVYIYMYMSCMPKVHIYTYKRLVCMYVCMANKVSDVIYVS